MTAATRRSDPSDRQLTENELERRFFQLVRTTLRGHMIKLAPLEKGTPDRLVLLPGGRMYLVELKTERGKLSKAQLVWHLRHGKRGGTVHVLYGMAQIEDWVAARYTDIWGQQ